MQSIGVFCGARQGKGQAYEDAAVELAREIVKRNLTLVYGGGTVGLMGIVAKLVEENLGKDKVLGVIPSALQPREVSGPMIGTTKVVDDMHTRKALMAKYADAFVALPGGFGTMEELLEVVTWQQLGFHEKPIGILNINGYFDHLLKFFDHCVEEDFVSPSHRTVLVATNPAELLDKMMEFKAPESLIRHKMNNTRKVLGEDIRHHDQKDQDFSCSPSRVGKSRFPYIPYSA